MEHILCLSFVIYCLSSCPTGECQLFRPYGMQRRFMWQPLDHTMEGFMGGVVSSARAMFSDILPTVQTTSSPNNAMDYLPSETTRIKYIIHRPQNTPKTMRIVKVRTPKKIIKIMTPSNKMAAHQYHQQNRYFPNKEELRKIEIEQEMIAEGRSPPKTGTEILEEIQSEKKNKEYKLRYPKNDNEIIKGKSTEIGNGWKPVQNTAKEPAAFSTAKPHAMSQLHTNIIGERLPEPQKQVFELQESQEYDESLQTHLQTYEKPINTYEVNEHTAEESIVMPLTLDHRGTSDFTPSAFRGLHNKAQTSSAITSTTTEEPNYPSAFLKRNRERISTTIQPHPVSRFNRNNAAIDSPWIPSLNVTAYDRPKQRQPQQILQKQPHHHQDQHHHQYQQQEQNPQQKKSHRTKSEKWSPEITTGSTTKIQLYQSFSTTKSPVIYSEPTVEEIIPTRKNVRTKTTNAQREQSQIRDVNQRGSVKFGDRVNSDQF